MSPKKSAKKSTKKSTKKSKSSKISKVIDKKIDDVLQIELIPVIITERIVNHQGFDIFEKELITITEFERLATTPILPKFILNENNTGFIVKNGHITELNVINTKLCELPLSLENLNSLESLNLKFNHLTQLPPIICSLTKLQILNLDGNQLKSLPQNFGELQYLKKLTINDNQITRLPESFSSLNLQKLSLAGNKLISLFHSFGHFKILISLELQYNQLKKLPDSMENIISLQTMNLEGNQFESLPDSICKLESLESLYLTKNFLSFLPHHFGDLKKLTKLNISSNKFTTLPTQIGYLNELRDLNLQNNPFEGESKTIVTRDLFTIKNWCLQRADIHIFISHAVVDYKQYRLDELEKFLEQCPGIYEVFCCEKDLVGDIDKFMQEFIPKSQLFIILATKNSIVKSKDCKYEIELAKKHNLEIIPIRGLDVTWNELAEVGLNREFGMKYNPENFTAFCQELYEYISKIRKSVNLFDKAQAQIDKKLLNVKNTIINFLESADFKRHFLEHIKDLDEILNKLAKLEITQQEFVELWAKKMLI